MFVSEIDYKTAMDVCITKHYLMRKCPCSQAFGLFTDEGELVGVSVFGKPSSYTLCNGIAGRDESKNVVEFNRLWVDDRMPANTESWFLSRALKKCTYQIIVSFADSAAGHVGYIYQATNWIYCGVSKGQRYYRLKSGSCNAGLEQYRRRERMPRRKIVEEYGEEFVEEYYSSSKHRYLYVNASGRRRRQILSKILYKQLPYPKSLASS